MCNNIRAKMLMLEHIIFAQPSLLLGLQSTRTVYRFQDCTQMYRVVRNNIYMCPSGARDHKTDPLEINAAAESKSCCLRSEGRLTNGYNKITFNIAAWNSSTS